MVGAEAARSRALYDAFRLYVSVNHPCYAESAFANLIAKSMGLASRICSFTLRLSVSRSRYSVTMEP